MKKISLLLTIVLIACLFTACGEQIAVEETQTTENTTVEATETQAENVKFTVEKSVLADKESFVQEMKEYGAVVGAVAEPDGYSFEFTKAEHQKLLDDKYKEAIDNFKKYEENPEHYVDKIEYNEDFRNITINVDKELYDANPNKSSEDIAIAAIALSYQLYLEGKQRTTVSVVYSGTDEEVSSFALPMSFNIG